MGRLSDTNRNGASARRVESETSDLRNSRVRPFGRRATRSKIVPLTRSIRPAAQRLAKVVMFGPLRSAATAPSSAMASINASDGQVSGSLEPSHRRNPNPGSSRR